MAMASPTDFIEVVSVGLALARMEIKVAAREIVRQLKNIKLAIPESEITYLPTVATHTIESLPITYSKR